jgi:hypothetical protein
VQPVHERQTDDDEFVTIDMDDQQQRNEKPDRVGAGLPHRQKEQCSHVADGRSLQANALAHVRAPLARPITRECSSAPDGAALAVGVPSRMECERLVDESPRARQ